MQIKTFLHLVKFCIRDSMARARNIHHAQEQISRHGAALIACGTNSLWDKCLINDEWLLADSVLPHTHS